MQTVKIEEVNIETINTCTRKCSYCKFGIERKWDKKVMPTEIFEKILYDLREIHYSGLIGPFVNNEPLMDKRMTSFVKMISNVLPAAKSYLISNGDLLDQTILRDLLDAGLHRLFVSVHSRECFERLSELASRFGREKVTLSNFFDTDKTTYFHNRGGSIKADTVNQARYLDGGCCLPFRQVVVNPDGNVYLCCCDFYYDVVFDNVRTRSLVDIFSHDIRLNQIRDQFRHENRKGLVLCEDCSVPPYAPLLTI